MGRKRNLTDTVGQPCEREVGGGISEPAETPFESGSGKFVFAEGAAEQVFVAVRAPEGSFGAFGLLGTGGMREK